jgi:hypothetical protein
MPKKFCEDEGKEHKKMVIPIGNGLSLIKCLRCDFEFEIRDDVEWEIL